MCVRGRGARTLEGERGRGSDGEHGFFVCAVFDAAVQAAEPLSSMTASGGIELAAIARAHWATYFEYDKKNEGIYKELVKGATDKLLNIMERDDENVRTKISGVLNHLIL